MKPSDSGCRLQTSSSFSFKTFSWGVQYSMHSRRLSPSLPLAVMLGKTLPDDTGLYIPALSIHSSVKYTFFYDFMVVLCSNSYSRCSSLSLSRLTGSATVPNVEVGCNPLSVSARLKQVATLGVHVSCMYTMHVIRTVQPTHYVHLSVLTGSNCTNSGGWAWSSIDWIGTLSLKVL